MTTVWVVIYQDWDTNGHASDPRIVGVFTTKDLIPKHIINYDGTYSSYTIEEVEVDKIEKWA